MYTYLVLIKCSIFYVSLTEKKIFAYIYKGKEIKRMGWFTDLIFRPDDETLSQSNALKDKLTLEKEFLEKVTYDDVDVFHLNGLECWAKVVKVYDADTIHCVFFINSKAYKFKIRLSGIDSAEKKSDDIAERGWALKGISRLLDLIDGKLVYLKCHKWDKYGRLLADIYLDKETVVNGGESFNQILVKEGLAYEYNGGSRRKFRDWAPWIAWLDYAEYRPSDKVKPVDNVGDQEVLDYKPIEGVDYKISENVANKK
tara:strand:+ start:1059 stop:1826 length:768 start_codon:yes stop_codon:yes gene_type:complete